MSILSLISYIHNWAYIVELILNIGGCHVEYLHATYLILVNLLESQTE